MLTNSSPVAGFTKSIENMGFPMLFVSLCRFSQHLLYRLAVLPAALRGVVFSVSSADTQPAVADITIGSYLFRQGLTDIFLVYVKVV